MAKASKEVTEVTEVINEVAKEAEDLASRETIYRLKKNLDNKLETITNNIRKLDDTIEPRADKLFEKRLKRLEKINDVAVLDKYIVDMEKRLDVMGERLHLMIHKETILTEISRYARDKSDWLQLAQFHVAVMKAFNMPDEWWGLESRDLLIIEWYSKIMNLLEEQ